jgi:hypothetical protein
MESSTEIFNITHRSKDKRVDLLVYLLLMFSAESIYWFILC